ncbi:MAG: hypothetical protein ACI9RU_002613, partial [Litorivivens sp.]
SYFEIKLKYTKAAPISASAQADHMDIRVLFNVFLI